MEPRRNQESDPIEREVVRLEISRELFERLSVFANKSKVTPVVALDQLLRNADKAERRANNSSFIGSLESNWVAAFTSVMFIAGMILAVVYILRQ